MASVLDGTILKFKLLIYAVPLIVEVVILAVLEILSVVSKTTTCGLKLKVTSSPTHFALSASVKVR